MAFRLIMLVERSPGVYVSKSRVAFPNVLSQRSMFPISCSLLNEFGQAKRVIHVNSHLLESKVLALFPIHIFSFRFTFQNASENDNVGDLPPWSSHQCCCISDEDDEKCQKLC